ncbi:hypothetical protein GRI39_11335 [Altererythrobacter indicus]|uniref:Oligosaccharide flippase family protein n=1 Tax=Altericroceibacterium indicum TaxID=374177 RepID=A0A845AHP1_9SPHN|nr:hypothetical protein [Altericroceibacterium indicum]MXP26628.1 hypothetical protein [Altericroceibacterium indicum]
MHRMMRGILGQMSGRAMIAVYQLAIIPLMIANWGLSLYGEWLILTGLATYLAVSGQGLTTASAMKLIRCIKRGDSDAAQGIIHGSVATLIVVGALFTVMLLGLLYFTNWANILSLHVMGKREIIGVAAAAALQIIVISLRNIPMAISHAAGDYGRPALCSSMMRLLEFSGSAVMLLAKVNPLELACWIAVITLLDYAVQMRLACAQSPDLELRPGFHEWHNLRDLLGPTFGNLGVACAINGIGVQGFRLATAALLGSADVAALAVYTALLRLSEHCANMVLPIIQLELARQAEGQEGKDTAIAMIGLSVLCGLMIAAGWLACLLMVGPQLLSWWTSGEVVYDPVLLIVLGAAAIFVQLGRPSLTYLIARNLVALAGCVMMASWSLALAIAFPLAQLWGLHGVAFAMVSGELAALIACSYLAGRYLIGNPLHYAAIIFDGRKSFGLIAGKWMQWRRAPGA